MPEPVKPELPPVAPPVSPTPPPVSQAKKPAGAAKALTPQVKHKKNWGTFAPQSPYKDLREVIKPHKGGVVEVIVAWKDRILSTNTFTRSGSVFISANPDADVVVPIVNSRSKYELLKIQGQITVCLTQEMTGELIRDGEVTSFPELARQNKIRHAGSHYELDVRQGEMVRVGLQQDLISIYVRYIADAPKPLVPPLFDMSSSDDRGHHGRRGFGDHDALYEHLHASPALEDEALQEEPIARRSSSSSRLPKERS
ncbi:MAG: hypothetical protein HC902_04930 [Calothrix sp. SM1_5_4]|nr:hypothetical protein [Calothrix sp. SM1_5_4]